MSDLLANAAIQQINLGYDAEQDRLLLKVGLSDDSEISAWLTRRIVKTLWALLQQAGISTLAMTTPVVLPAETPEGDEAGQPATTGTNAQANYEESYQPRTNVRLGEPLLAKSCQLVIAADSQSTLELTARDGATIKIALSTELTQALGHMLQLATREASWDISFTTSRLMVSESSTRPVLH